MCAQIAQWLAARPVEAGSRVRFLMHAIFFSPFKKNLNVFKCGAENILGWLVILLLSQNNGQDLKNTKMAAIFIPLIGPIHLQIEDSLVDLRPAKMIWLVLVLYARIRKRRMHFYIWDSN